jgi:hypothetical protein
MVWRRVVEQNSQYENQALSRTTQQPLRTPTSRNNPRDMQQHFFNESF